MKNFIYKINDKVTYKDFESFLRKMEQDNLNIRKLFTYNLRNEKRELKSFKNSILITVRKDKKLIGFTKIITDYSYFFYFTDVMVLPSYRNKNIGITMMKKGLEYCKKNGFIKIFLTPAKGLENYYKRLGFRFSNYAQMVILGEK